MDRCDEDQSEECNRGREREMHGVLDVRGRVEEKKKGMVMSKVKKVGRALLVEEYKTAAWLSIMFSGQHTYT